jgi:hypothetical protein
VSADKPEGSGPDGRITPEDIRAKAESLASGVEGSVQSAKPLLMYAAVGGALFVVIVSYWLGRRGGRRRSTIVEIRRG